MQKILIIAPAWVGDAVMTQVLLKQLKIQAPDSQIDILAPEWTFAIFSRMPEVRTCIPAPFLHGEFNFIGRFRLAKTMRARQYDQAIVLPNSWKSALLPFLARIPKRTGWLGECRYGLLNDVRRLNAKQYPRMIDRFAALAFPENHLLPVLSVPKLEVLESELQSSLALFQISKIGNKKRLALCPGAEFGGAKRWPLEYFIQVAQWAIENHFEIWLFGSPKEKEMGEQIEKKVSCRNWIGKTSLTQCMDLLSVVDGVVSHDSGLMHIAAALQKSLIVLYGSTSPDFTPPLSDKVLILKTQLACQPCHQRECPLGHHRCMKELMPERVIELLKTIQEK